MLLVNIALIKRLITLYNFRDAVEYGGKFGGGWQPSKLRSIEVFVCCLNGFNGRQRCKAVIGHSLRSTPTNGIVAPSFHSSMF